MRGVDVLTAHEDGTAQMEDPALLTRATELERVLFTRDDDLLVEAVRRQREEIDFAGVIYAHQLQASIGQCVHDLEMIAKAGESLDMVNRIEYLPL